MCKVVLGLLFVFSLSRAPIASAQQSTPTDDEVNAIAKKLYCPVCENMSLDVCPTQACVQWRATIREKLEAGWSEQQILDYFVAQYGERVLAQPSTRGLNILVWVIPPLVLIAGIALYAFYVRKLVAPATSAGPATPEPAPTNEYVNRLEQELDQRR